MKKTYYCSFISILAGTTATIIALASTPLSWGQNRTAADQESIGVYDSRAVALAYVGSTFQVNKMKELTAQLKKARQAGDRNRVSSLEGEGHAWQATLNQQGFGTAPVDDLLAQIASDLPIIQQAAGVRTIVSKFDRAELDRHPMAVRVDITMQLVDAFQPNETQRKRAIEIQKIKPLKPQQIK